MQPCDRTREPDLDEALRDPIVLALMASDGVSLEDMRQLMEAARRRLRADVKRLAA